MNTASSAREKANSPQRHREHREIHIEFDFLCVLCVSVVDKACMGRQEKSKPAAAPAPTPASPVRIILADGQAIYRVGIRKIFALEDDLRVLAQAESFPQ